MTEKTEMKLRSPEEIIKGLKLRYCTKKDNVEYLDRLFMAASVIRWAFKNTGSTEEIFQYLAQVERYMDDQIDLYWKDGVIKIRRDKKV